MENKELLKLLALIVEQNNTLIENMSSKQAYIIELLEALAEASDDEEEDYDVDDMYRTLD